MTISQKKSFLINLLFVVALAVLGFFVVKYVFVWMFPFVLGVLVAIALQRPVDWLAKKTPVPRAVWALGLVLLVVSVLSVLIIVLGNRLYVELSAFIKKLSSYSGPLTKAFDDMNSSISHLLDGLPPAVEESIREMPSNLISSLTSSLSGVLTGIVNFIFQSGPAFLVTVIMSVVACCFLTKDYYLVSAFLERQLSEKHWSVLTEAKHVFVSSVLKMLRGYMLIMFITFAELAIGFSILRVDYAIVIALLVSIVDIMPVLGTGTVLIPWALISLIMGDYLHALGIGVLYLAIMVIRNILEPKIIGKQVGLPAIVTLMSMYLGLQLFGLVGMFGIPITVIVLKRLQDSGQIKIWK